ncbi:aldo/keto reductase [bacterium]|nr:aldo/keto reductase [bacterium]
MRRRRFLQGIGVTASVMSLGGCSVMPGRKTEYRPRGVVPKRALGKTGIEVSMLGFGSHLVKKLIGKPRLRDRLIKLGFEGGINTFDVYDHAGYKQFEPMSESIRDFRREVIVSLVAVQPTPEMENEIDGALRTFRTDYIDLYRLQNVDDDRIRVLEKSRDSGKIRKIGIVSHDANLMMRYIDNYRNVLDYVMIIYNFHHNMGRPKGGQTWPWNDYNALIPRCSGMGLGIIGIKPMGSDDMAAFAHKKGFFKDKRGSLAKAMLRFIYQAPEVHCTMPAMNSMDEVIANLESAYAPAISPEERSMLSDLSREADALKGAYLSPRYRWLENWAVRNA